MFFCESPSNSGKYEIPSILSGVEIPARSQAVAKKSQEALICYSLSRVLFYQASEQLVVLVFHPHTYPFYVPESNHLS